MNRNYVRLKGHLGAAPEVRLTQNGDKMMQLKLATNDNYRTADGNWNQKTQWHQIQVFNQALIQQLEGKFAPGDYVLVEGTLEYIPRETPSGEKYKKAVAVVRKWGALEKLEPRASTDPINFSTKPQEVHHD